MEKYILLALLLIVSVPAPAANPHDGYVFWLPSGELKIDDAASVKEFNYTATPQGESFTIRPRHTRFDVPRGQLVIIRRGAGRNAREFTVDGRPAGRLGLVTFIPTSLTEGKNEVRIVTNVPAAERKGYLIYYTDDLDKLGQAPLNYTSGLMEFWKGDYVSAKQRFTAGAEESTDPQSARLFRRLGRWCEAEMQYPKITTGEGFYNLGLYSMTNGFWDVAADCFKKATELMPDNPDAWYMLGDAMSYKISDLDKRMELIYPYYRKAADLYPHDDSNTFRTFFGFFRNLRIKENNQEKVLHMTDEQMDYAKKAWEWCSAIMESASRGALRMVNTYKVYDQEFDGTDDWNAKPFEGLFQPGTVDTFAKMTGWGASDCCGMDCGPDRSAFINLGIREWDVMLHEWNHSLDWAMVTSELGTGVPETHSSDWCGFEPISSMGMGHHSCNRYYMTPGMYRCVRGSDPATTDYVTDWTVSTAAELVPETAKIDDTFTNDLRKKTTEVAMPTDTGSWKPAEVENGYIDLKAMMSDASKNAYAFAQTYVYSPKKQKVRMWIGADDNIRIWLNDRLIHKGVYWACALFTEKKEKDQTAAGVMLEKGWNHMVVQVTDAQHNPDWLGGDPPDAWGFSVRFCDIHNKAVPGLKWRSREPAGFVTPVPFVVDPKAPKTYSWDRVKDDYTTLLPELSIDDLRAITGYRNLTATNEIFFDVPESANSHVIAKPDPNNIALNNELNWYFSPKEMAAVVRYKRGNQTRDLLFLRPEASETYLTLMPVTPEARKLGIKRQADRVIGYFLTKRSDCANGRIAMVLDTRLPDQLPTDEEDLLQISDLR